jgi:hypothetical protein
MYKKSNTPRPIVTRTEALEARDKAIADAHALYGRRVLEIEKAERDTQKRPEPSARARQAWEMRQKGTTFKAIGAALGITGGRASHLVNRYERFMEQQKAGDARSELSARAYNTIWNHGLDPNDPESLSKVSGLAFSRTPNMGRKTFAEIIKWLESKGYELAP